LPVVRPARIFLALSIVLAAAVAPPASSAVAAAGAPKVAIIVGPTGSLTDTYRSRANLVADAALAAGATVSKAYSPRATWKNVLAAVEGANIIVYFGHGNGYPNPYSSTEWTDRANGWGLNRTTQNGDRDNWSTTLVYCGEKALLGRLGANDGAAQRKYCAGGPIKPAPGFVMVYAQAHYAPGFGERYEKADPRTTYTQARQRVRNYSYPVFALGGSAFFATAYRDAQRIVARVLEHRDRTYGWIFKQGTGYDADALRTSDHPDTNGRIWVQKTVIRGFHFGQADYWYAFAGRPRQTVQIKVVATFDETPPSVVTRSPGNGKTGVSRTARPWATFSEPVERVNANTMTLVERDTGAAVAGTVRYNATSDTARFVPEEALEPNTTYLVKLAGWIRDGAGNRLGYVSWKFTTGD
jgi:hypothetical protein